MKNFKHCPLAIALVVIVCAPVVAQRDIVKSEGITSAVHQANLGKIRFTEKAVAVQSLKETDFLDRLS